jgi:uncharacterized protein (DUF1501 family)
MNRRQMLKHMLSGALYMATGLSGTLLCQRSATAVPSRGKTLLVVFLRGGCDGLNTVVPYGDPGYAALRPTIGVPAPGTSAVAALDLDGFFGFHPAFAPLMPLYDAGELAVFPAVHHERPSRSHFDSERLIESGAPAETLNGWLNRHLANSPADATLRALGIEVRTPQSLRGAYFAPTFPDLGRLSLSLSADDSSEIEEFLLRAYAVLPVMGGENALAAHALGPSLLSTVRRLRSVDALSYVPSGGASYPGTTFGRQLKAAAQLIKLNWGLEVTTLSMGGWDTHAEQGGVTGVHANNLTELASGLAALRSDLGERMCDVLVLVMTEFGRTAAENGSRGTDHGHASAWFTLGGGTLGGVYGDWPGLSPAELREGRYLAHSIDYRDVFAEIVARHLGNESGLSVVLPDHVRRPLGFLT